MEGVILEGGSHRSSLGIDFEDILYRFRREIGHQWKIPMDSDSVKIKSAL